MKKIPFKLSSRLFVPARRRINAFTAISLVIGLALGGCNNRDDKTVGQKLDSAIAKTSEAAAQVKAKTEHSAEQAKTKSAETFANAGVAMKNATQKAETSLKNAAGKANEKIADFVIMTAVSSEIGKDTELSVLKIKVETQDGVVTLNGTSPTEAARDKASALVKAIQGVRSVDNKLIVNAS